MSRLLLFTAMISLASVSFADKVDDIVRKEMETRKVQGAVVAVIKNGKVAKKAAYGYANIENHVKVRLDSVFEIGSITKQFTATLVMKLVEEGKLRLDQPVCEYMPDIPPAWKAITLRLLLAHQSGLKNVNEVDGMSIFDNVDYAKFIKGLSSHPLEFVPGTKYAYRNTGYCFAGHIIERVTGKPYWTYLSEIIFKPLGMSHSQQRDPSSVIKNRVSGYDLVDGKALNRASYLTDINAAGAITSTILDLIKWNAAIDKNRVVSADSQKLMWTPNNLSDGKATRYGLGWIATEYRGAKLLTHGGSTSGFSAVIQKYVDSGVTIIILTNCETLNTAAFIAQEVAPEYVDFKK